MVSLVQSLVCSPRQGLSSNRMGRSSPHKDNSKPQNQNVQLPKLRVESLTVPGVFNWENKKEVSQGKEKGSKDRNRAQDTNHLEAKHKPVRGTQTPYPENLSSTAKDSVLPQNRQANKVLYPGAHTASSHQSLKLSTGTICLVLSSRSSNQRPPGPQPHPAGVSPHAQHYTP